MSVKTLKYSDSSHKTLKIGVIPKSVTSLIFYKHFYGKISKNQIPDSVEHLVFAGDFSRKIQPGIIPNSVKRLEFGNNYYQHLESGSIPDSVTTLTIGNYFKALEPELIPKSLETIYLPKKKMQVLKNIPITFHIIYTD